MIKENFMKNVIVTVGLPHSGKSTWAKKQNVPIVNRDAIRLAVHGQPYIQEVEDFITLIEEYMVNSLFLAGNETIIIDATHATQSRRDRWISDKWQTSFRHFPTSKTECIARARANNREDLIPIIESMAKKIDIQIDED
jgi:predicted kinase